MMVNGPNGAPAMMPLGQVASIHEGLGPAIIDHLNREPVVTVELNTAGRAAGDVTNDIEAMLQRVRLPAGVHYTIGGDAESQAEVFGQIFSALGLAVFLRRAGGDYPHLNSYGVRATLNFAGSAGRIWGKKGPKPDPKE